MKRKIKYDSNSIIKIQIKTNQAVVIKNQKDEKIVFQTTFPNQKQEARVVGRWIVECDKAAVYLRENNSYAPSGCIELEFQKKDGTVLLSYIDGNKSKESNEGSVRRICVYPREIGEISLETTDSAKDKQTASYNNELEIQSLRLELEKERTNIRMLNEMLKMRLDEFAQKEQKQVEALNAENQRLFSTLNMYHETICSIESQIEQKGREKMRLEKELKTLDEQKEFLELDCDAARNQVNDLKEQVHLDSETISLIEGDLSLKKGTITKTIPYLQKEVEKIEKRIALIIKVRREFDKKVNKTIFSGDGFIFDVDEILDIGEEEEDTDGDGGTA